MKVRMKKINKIAFSNFQIFKFSNFQIFIQPILDYRRFYIYSKCTRVENPGGGLMFSEIIDRVSIILGKRLGVIPYVSLNDS